MIAQTEPMNQGEEAPRIQYLEYVELHASPTNPRKHFDEGPMQELSENIHEHGVRMPLLARPSKEKPGSYEIVAGERRFRATGMALERLAKEEDEARYAKLFKLPVIVQDLDDATVLELQLIENLQRQDLTPMEEARGYQRLLDLPGGEYTPQKIAQKISKHVATVLTKLKILKAPESLQKALDAGYISERHLVLVASIPAEKAREECAKKVMEGKQHWDEEQRKPLSVRETLSLIADSYRMSLKGVLWSLDDAELVPAAGACSQCPHFAKKAAEQDPELASNLGNGRGDTDPMTCMHPDCWRKKQEATLKVMKAAEKGGDVKVMKPAEQEKVINDHGGILSGSKMVKLDDKLPYEILGHYNDEKAPTWREVIGPVPPAGSVQIANTKHAGLVELMDKKAAIEAAKGGKHASIFARVMLNGKKEKTAAEVKQREKELFAQKVEQRERFVLFDHLAEVAAEKGGTMEAALVTFDIVMMDAGMDGCRFMAEWLKLEVQAPKKESLNQQHYREAVLKHVVERGCSKHEVETLIMLASVAKWVKITGIHSGLVKPIYNHYGFDAKTINALAKSQIEAELAAKAAKKKPKLKSKGRDLEPAAATEKANATVATAEIIKQGDKERKKAPSRKRGMVAVQPAKPEKDPKDILETLAEQGQIFFHGSAEDPKTWTLEQKAKALIAGTHDLAVLIGVKPNRKDKEALKVWDAERYRVRTAAAKLR